jgi:tRNA A37 methylthiotransferase MiaB
LAECGELQDSMTARRRSELVGTRTTVLVDRPGEGRSHREAPEIDGIIQLPGDTTIGLAGKFITVEITGAAGTDLEGAIIDQAVA